MRCQAEIVAALLCEDDEIPSCYNEGQVEVDSFLLCETCACSLERLQVYARIVNRV